MSSVLILGANGHVGTELSKEFDKSGIDYTPITRDQFVAGQDNPSKIFSPYRPHDYLINCIAFHKVDQCENDHTKSFTINAEVPGQLARYCQETKMKLIHFSTDYVFSGEKKSPYIETDLPGPVNAYGISKMAGEAMVRIHSTNHFIFRVSSLFGPPRQNDPVSNFVEKMIVQAQEGKQIKVIDDQFMSPTYTTEIAKVIASLITDKVDQFGTYHLCNSGQCSWYEFAQAIFEIAEIKADLSPISYKQFHATVNRPQFCSMSNEKFQSIYKIRDWKSALESYLTSRSTR